MSYYNGHPELGDWGRTWDIHEWHATELLGTDTADGGRILHRRCISVKRAAWRNIGGTLRELTGCTARYLHGEDGGIFFP